VRGHWSLLIRLAVSLKMGIPNRWVESAFVNLPFEPNLAKAHTLPSSVYFGPEVFEAETERIFFRTWQTVGRLEDVSRPGDFFTCELLGQPLVVVRDKSGELRAFYNVCRHRAGTVAVGKGNRKVLQCRYHGWTYGLDGNLLAAREFDGVEDFEVCKFALKSIQVSAWGPLVMVNLDPQAAPLEEFFGEVVSETANLPNQGLRLVERREYRLECNWKVYVENYLEGYHIPIAHPGLFREIDYNHYRVEPRRFHSRQIAPLRPAEDGANRRYAPLEPDEDVLYYWVFPNLMLNYYPDNLQVNIIIPEGPDRTLTLFEWYFSDQGSAEGWEAIQQGIAFSDEVQKEDIEICEAVQKGLASRAYDKGRFCPARENGVHHFQGLVAEFLKD
jgi:phenylpropionate dioxygenase-like ring-hydroxylating dioxygenase large terminal subunit